MSPSPSPTSPTSPKSTQGVLEPEPPTASPSSPAQADPLEAKKIVRSPFFFKHSASQRVDQVKTDKQDQAALEAKIAALETQIREAEEKRREVDGQLK